MYTNDSRFFIEMSCSALASASPASDVRSRLAARSLSPCRAAQDAGSLREAEVVAELRAGRRIVGLAARRAADAMFSAMRAKRDLPQEFSIIKMGIGPHSDMPQHFSDYTFEQGSTTDPAESHGRHDQPRGIILTEKGFAFTVAVVKAMKEVLGDEVGLALDCGPGLAPSDLLRLAKEFEPLHLLWVEDGYTGATENCDHILFVSVSLVLSRACLGNSSCFIGNLELECHSTQVTRRSSTVTCIAISPLEPPRPSIQGSKSTSDITSSS